METEKWYEIRTKLGAMFSDYLVNKITYAEIENQVIGWIEKASKKPSLKIKFEADDIPDVVKGLLQTLEVKK